MAGLTSPTYEDLTECLSTLATKAEDTHVPGLYLDLYYHAYDLAERFDERDATEDDARIAPLIEEHLFDEARVLAEHRARVEV